MTCILMREDGAFSIYLGAQSQSEEDYLLALYNDSINVSPRMIAEHGIGKWATDINSINPKHSVSALKLILSSHIKHLS